MIYQARDIRAGALGPDGLLDHAVTDFDAWWRCGGGWCNQSTEQHGGRGDPSQQTFQMIPQKKYECVLNPIWEKPQNVRRESSSDLLCVDTDLVRIKRRQLYYLRSDQLFLIKDSFGLSTLTD